MPLQCLLCNRTFFPQRSNHRFDMSAFFHLFSNIRYILLRDVLRDNLFSITVLSNKSKWIVRAFFSEIVPLGSFFNFSGISPASDQRGLFSFRMVVSIKFNLITRFYYTQQVNHYQHNVVYLLLFASHCKQFSMLLEFHIAQAFRHISPLTYKITRRMLRRAILLQYCEQ